MRWGKRFKGGLYVQKCRFITLLFLLVLTMTACSSNADTNYESADSTHTDLPSFESKESEEPGTEEEGMQKEENTMKILP